MFVIHVLGVMRVGTRYSLVNTKEKKIVYFFFSHNPIELKRKFVKYKLEAEK